MGALYTAEEIMEVTEARIAVGMMHEDVGEICTDTRLLQEGQWFLALHGEQFDGHDFLGEAFSGGAIGCIVEERTSYPIASTGFPLLAVPDTTEALGQLARNWRKRINPRIALIPVEETLEALIDYLNRNLSRRFQEQYIFMPNAGRLEIFEKILAMPDDAKAVMIQYHLNSFKEIESLGKSVLPSVVLLTEESIESFRLSLTAADLAAIPFAIMPNLKLNHGLAIVDSNFSEQLLSQVADSVLRNVVIFGRSASSSNQTQVSPLSFLRAAGTDDEKVVPMLRRAQAYAEKTAESEDYLDLVELAAMVMMMMGIEFDAATKPI